MSQPALPFREDAHPAGLLPSVRPFYRTSAGATYLGDSRELMAGLPDNSVNLVFTSPPYALHFKKEYGNVEKSEYVDWILGFAEQIKRVLTDDGSFVLNLGGSYNPGIPTRSTYHLKVLLALTDKLGFHLAQELFWYNPAKLPMPAEWVTVRRIRVKDSVEYLWWLSKTPWPKASNRRVLKEYSPDMIRLNAKKLRKTTRPSGHRIKPSFKKIDAGGSIPSNVIEPSDVEDFIKAGNNSANDPYTLRCKEAGIKIHPARFPATLPDFFVRLLTEEGDLVLDPFAGSNTTGMVAQRLSRRWLSVDMVEDYLTASRFRFEPDDLE